MTAEKTTRLPNRPARIAFFVGVLLAAGPAGAFEFEIADTSIRVDSLFTVGASWRTQERDRRMIGKINLNPGLCVARVGDDGVSGPDPVVENNGFIGDTCSTSNTDNQEMLDEDGDPIPRSQSNIDYVNAPGSFNINGDDGNLNFDKYDIVHAAAKLTSDINFELLDFSVFVRPIYFFDTNYSNGFKEYHPDTTLQPRETELSDEAIDLVGGGFDILDFNISKVFNVADRDVSVKIGKQVLNWGESALLFLNSLNSINPPDARRARIPGFDLKEAFQPVGMVVASTDVMENLTLETFYQYDFTPLRIDSPGTFLSPSDTLGEGGRIAMLSFGKQPEDPDNLYRPYLNDGGDGPVPDSNDDPIGALGSFAGRTLYRNFAEEKDRAPNDGGQYGAALKFFLEDFNNGTELAFYHANYHSRLPVASAIAAQATCLDSAQGASSLFTNCGFNGPYEAADNEPVPVDSMSLLVEYPENIRMSGVSFNTTIGDFAFSGEYAYRDNLPIQIHTIDLVYAGLQPAFPTQDIPVPGVATIPGRRSAVPSFLTQYRGYECTTDANCIQPGQYIRGYESLPVGQLGLTVLRLIGGDNPIGASQMTILFEMGWTQIMDMPEKDELVFNAAGGGTHISDGADGTSNGLNANPVAGNAFQPTLRQNPTAADPDDFGHANSYGYRLINLNRWDSAIFGANLETLSIIRHDVKGTTPGIGGNFVEGRKEFNFGIRGDYLSTYIGEIRYTWYTGGGTRNSSIDRDHVFVTFGVQF